MNGVARASARRRPARARPRTVLAWLVLAIVVATGMYAVAPWILPVRVYEGPMVQMAGPEGATLVWYTTRPTDCTLLVTVDGQSRSKSAESDGRRNRARIDGLAPGGRYPYEILVGQRRLTQQLAFQTNRAAGEAFTFFVLGDSGKGSRVQYLLAGQMAGSASPADFVLHTGDLVYPDGARRRYEPRFFAPYRRLLARVNYWPCLGNHDVDDEGRAAPYASVFDLPENGPAGLPAEHNYWFDYASCRVAVIDSNVDETTLAEITAPWLREVMSGGAARWRFVSLHHPPHTGGSYEPDERIQRTLVPVFEAVGIDVVFAGHDHLYQRMLPLRGGEIVEPHQGVLYIVSGAGGARLYEAREPRPGYVAALDNEHHSYTEVAVEGDELDIRQITLDGEVIDQYTTRKNDAAPETQPAQARNRARPAADTLVGDGEVATLRRG